MVKIYWSLASLGQDKVELRRFIVWISPLSHISLIAPLQASMSGFFPGAPRGSGYLIDGSLKVVVESCNVHFILLKMFSMFRVRNSKTIKGNSL